MRLLHPNDENIRIAAFVILEGGIVVYPTETVYGLGCLPSDPDASRKICELKGRADKPLPLICSDVDAVRKIVLISPAAEKLAEKFWPGPLTLVLPSKVKYPMWVTHGASTLGVRVTSHPVAAKLAKLSNGVIVSTSANISGEEPAKTAQEAVKFFGNKVGIVLDDGPSPGSIPSTILEMSGEELWLIRKGPITSEQIMEVLRS